MPVVNLAEARDLDPRIADLLVALPAQRLAALRRVFVDGLDFEQAQGEIPLHDVSDNLPPSVQRVARLDGVDVALAQFPSGIRLTAKRLADTLKAVKQILTDVFLVATDANGAEWQFVYPEQKGGREVLRRMAVHKGQPYRTVAEQLSKVYTDRETRGGIRAALEHAYDVEAVTKRFFGDYKRIFEQVKGMVTGLSDDEERRLFCQTLFNRLMFLYFLQRKGWLTFNDDPDYLNALWKSYHAETIGADDSGAGFYTTRLRPLFFAALNRPHAWATSEGRKDFEPVVGRVPFLNGGLFAQEGPDHRYDVGVPDEAIRLILQDLFARYNFTISESTPYDVEVAVDPEMLGKVFEELVTGRHETGSYYTPRPIVSFMCREALKGYLIAHVPALAAAAAAAFVDDHDISKLTITQANKVLAALEAVTVVDPACGSGAYLLGMLHELVDLQRLLYNSNLIAGAKELYDLKLRVIQQNVYGVDIDRFAVNIAMLRLWLSLVVEYDGPGEPPALPNLDYKVARGDSLSAPDPQGETDLFRHAAVEQAAVLATLKGEFMRATGDEKRTLHYRYRTATG